jgi:hypothetical protein
MMSGCSVTSNTEPCSSSPSELESEEDEVLSSSDSELSLEEVDEDKALFA